MMTKLINENSYVQIEGLCAAPVNIKVEGLNPAGSIKIKTALSMILDLEERGLITENTRLIESSSGNLGVALAMVCASRGYHFTCVIDPNISHSNKKLMAILGAEILVADRRDENGGYLNTRIRIIKDIVAKNKNYIWLNQYQNPANPLAHYRATMRSISEKFPKVDYLFIGAGTTGTLMGCRDFVTHHRPEIKIIAVDSEGSVTFGGQGGARFIPGLGTSRLPEIYNPAGIYDFVQIPEEKTIRMCRRIARSHGLLFGGSTGTVLAGVEHWSANIKSDDIVVAISPDMGERYLDTIYSDDWVEKHFNLSTYEFSSVAV